MARVVAGDLLLFVSCLILVAAIGFTVADLLFGFLDPDHQNPALGLTEPVWAGGSWTHPLGTDELGRDTLARLVQGNRTSLLIAVCAGSLAMVVGTSVGLVSGYFGGWVDRVLRAAVDVWMSFPGLLLALVILFAFGKGITVLILALAATHWSVFARVMRGGALVTKNYQYIEAAACLGATHQRILLRHLLPNQLPILVPLMGLEIATLLLSEGAISFLGFGVTAPQISLGLMLSQGRQYLFLTYWPAAIPGLLIALNVLLINTVATHLRDRLQR
ncbi:MAG: ABC transporter permease [Dehalococcoidia bacterium]